jgi:hypothetical protein
VDNFRILMGDEVSRKTKNAFAEGLARITDRLDNSLEAEKLKNDFLTGVPAIVEAIRSGKIACRVYRKEKFHAKAYPDLLDRIKALPGRVFSGKAHPSSGARAVFLCFAMPAPPAPARETLPDENAKWTEDSGDTRWYLVDISTEKIAEDPADIVKLIRYTPETARKNDIPRETLPEIRAKVEKHIKNTYLKQVQAPIGVKPRLKAWMELS